MKKIILFILLFTAIQKLHAQNIIVKDALKSNRAKLYRNLVNNTITKNLSQNITDSTEEDWEDAFGGIELIHYHSPWIDGRIQLGMDELQNHSISFQRAILELVYSNYKEQFYQQVKLLLLQTGNAKIFAMCAAYILQSSHGPADANFLSVKTKQFLQKDNDNPILQQLLYQVECFGKPMNVPAIKGFLQNNYLPGQVLLISFQRKDRDYPGLVMVRDTQGNFVKDTYGNYFAVPQLARSIGNLPGYLTNGNTPEGIFRMSGFDNSKSSFIGPTTNVQLTMPFEFKASHFFQNSELNDSAWGINYYKALLPPAFQNYYPLFQSYYAGKAGRTEIIAHGTTVNPAYYTAQTYYPLTPTQGCLCTKEIWDEETGARLQSDQQKLADAISLAGGPHGYAIVINIDDEQRPVLLADILPYF